MTASSTGRLDGFPIGILIPLAEEYRAISEVLRPVRSVETADETYYILQTPGGHEVLAVVVSGMGQEAAAVVADRLANRGIDLLVVLGIAGSLDQDVRLADVVVADVVDLYGNAAKAVATEEGGFELKLAGAPYRLSWALRRLLDELSLRPERAALWQGWTARAAGRRADLGITSAKAMPFTRPTPEIIVGNVASGAEVGASKAFSEWLKDRNRSYKAIEMESGGASLSAHRRTTALPVLVLRGISDCSDERKAKLDRASSNWPAGAWRKLAAQNAADLLATLVDADLLPLPATPALAPGAPVTAAAAPPAVPPGDSDQMATFALSLVIHIDLAEASDRVGPTTGQSLRQLALVARRLPWLVREAKRLSDRLDDEHPGLGTDLVAFLETDVPPYIAFSQSTLRAVDDGDRWLLDDERFTQERKAARNAFITGWRPIREALASSSSAAEALAVRDPSGDWKLLGFDGPKALAEHLEPSMDSLTDSPGELGEHVLSSLLAGPLELDELAAEEVPQEIRVGLVNRLLNSKWAVLSSSHEVTLTPRGRPLLERRLAAWAASRG